VNIGVLIPIIGVATGFMAVFGRMILKPILNARQQQLSTAKVQELEQKIAQLEARLSGTEGQVDTLLEEREFMRKLSSGRPR
jgi:uncharacterized protein involved in outer membrane biogenesis